ncbi:hypothetical protein PENNAL_c0545G01786, partial [Penicillium nalgiovense]
DRWVDFQLIANRSFLEYSGVWYRKQTKANYVGIRDLRSVFV